MTRAQSADRDLLDPTSPLVLHVTEAMGGGLQDAVFDFIRSAPQLRHALLFTSRGAFDTAEAMPGALVDVVDAGRGFRALHRAYGPVLARLRPDVVHLHSSWAGLIGRSRSPLGAAVVYTPHSYYFERQDLPLPVRGAAAALERGLSLRTDLVIGVSPAEAAIARRLGSPSSYIPNVARLAHPTRWTGGPEGATEVVAVGRVTAQKDPRFFLRVVKAVRSVAPGTRFTWVGGGDSRMEQRLRAAGVHVTGWVPRAESVELMRNASVYLHTAAWEGSPITLLEAASIGTPIVARSIRALDSLGFDPRLRTPDQVARAVVDVVGGIRRPVVPAAPQVSDQVRAIQEAYATVAPEPVLVPVPAVVPARSF